MQLTSLLCAASVGFALCGAIGCSHARCKEAGCSAAARVEYEDLVHTPYDLTVRTAGLVLVASCPVDARSAPPVAPNAATLICDSAGFTVATANAANGAATQVGTNPVDAHALTFEVELKPAGAALLQRTAEVALTHVERPNGPDCPSVCYGRQGKLNLKP